MKTLLSVVGLIAGLSFATGCRTPQEDYTIKSFENNSFPKSIDSVEQWNALESDIKAAILDSEYVRYPNLTLTPWKTKAELADQGQKGLMEKMQTFMASNGATDVSDETYSKVGPLATRVRFMMIGTSMIGAQIEYTQDSCEMPDESVENFASKESAENSGCELLTDNWRSRGLFNYTGAPLEYSDFMEWSH